MIINHYYNDECVQDEDGDEYVDIENFDVIADDVYVSKNLKKSDWEYLVENIDELKED